MQLFIFSCNAQIKSGKQILISKGIDFPLTEPHFLINPNNEKHFLVAAIVGTEPEVLDSNFPASHIVLFQSFDSGKTWQTKHFDENVDLGADPWLAINKNGTVILSALTKFKNKQSVYLVTYTSMDEGKTWEHPQNFGFGHDRQSIIVNPKTQEFLIVSSKYFLNDEEKRRSGMMCIHLSRAGTFMRSNTYLHGNVDIQMNMPVITPDGELLIPFIGYLANNKMLEYRKTWLLPSKNFGKSFSEPRLIYESETGHTNIVIDTTENFKNRIYSTKPFGKFREYKGFAMLYTDDNGESWSEQVKFGNEIGASEYMRNANISVSKNGLLGIFWYDRRNDPDKNDIYFTASLDGGNTFLPEEKITKTSTNPATKENGWTGKRWPVGGDYAGIQALSDGSFQLVWADSRNGYYQLFTNNIAISQN
ncbi:sialidase family protein [Aquimarina sp. M1]